MAKTKAQIQREYEKRTGYAAQAKYEKESVKRYVVKVMMNTETDIIKYLDAQENKSGYIKSLIRQDMKNKMKGNRKDA